jgi:hypothetical protein
MADVVHGRLAVDHGRFDQLRHSSRARRRLRCGCLCLCRIVVPVIAYTAELLGVTPGEPPVPVPRMLPPELLIHRRITTRPGPIPHGSHFGPGKQLQLPHALIVPELSENRCGLDHRMQAASRRSLSGAVM